MQELQVLQVLMADPVLMVSLVPPVKEAQATTELLDPLETLALQVLQAKQVSLVTQAKQEVQVLLVTQVLLVPQVKLALLVLLVLPDIKVLRVPTLTEVA